MTLELACRQLSAEDLAYGRFRSLAHEHVFPRSLEVGEIGMHAMLVQSLRLDRLLALHEGDDALTPAWGIARA